MTTSTLHQVVDLERYPITALESEAGQALVSRCREALARDAISVLPGFVRPEAVSAMANEARTAGPKGHRIDAPRISYEFSETGNWPAGHPRSVSHENRYRHVLNCQIPNDTQLRGLFLSPDLTEFVRQALGHPRLYTSACPYLALSLHIASEGDCNGWHFDANDGVVTLMLQQPDEGGAFEYAPYIRSDEDECYEAVEQLFASPETLARRPEICPRQLRALQRPPFDAPRFADRQDQQGADHRGLQLRPGPGHGLRAGLHRFRAVLPAGIESRLAG